MTPEGEGGQAVEPAPARRGGRARDASSRAADWTWGIFRRIHLGTRKPEKKVVNSIEKPARPR